MNKDYKDLEAIESRDCIWFVSYDGRYLDCLHRGELLIFEKREDKWTLWIEGQRVFFDDLYFALDWWDEYCNGNLLDYEDLD